MAHEPDRVDPVTDPVVRVAVLTIIDDELNQSAPELAEDLEHRVDYPEPVRR